MRKKLTGISILVSLAFLIGLSYLYSGLQGAMNANGQSMFTHTIVIDPGHGGFDGGATGVDKIVEKNINLDIALCLRDILEINGYKVVMTRDTDTALNGENDRFKSKKRSDMYNRLDLIEKSEDPIFISIHQNLFAESKYSGAQVFYGRLNENSEALATAMQEAFVKNLQPDNSRQIKQTTKDLFLLYNTKAPAVMVECGFLSNPTEAHRLITVEYQQQVAFTIFCGLTQYLQQAGEI